MNYIKNLEIKEANRCSDHTLHIFKNTTKVQCIRDNKLFEG